MAQTTDPTDVNKKGDYREKLSLLVILFSVVGVFLLAFLVIFVSWGKDWSKDTAQMVFTAVLPLFGAWVGTILAFYFGKENFEAATRSVTSIAKTIGLTEKLKEFKVKDKMIRRQDMEVEAKPDKEIPQIKLVDILKKIVDAGKGVRLPILNDKDHPVYMVHQSAIDRYIASQAVKKPPPEDLSALTLSDLLQDSTLKDWLEKSFATVKEDDTLAEAKATMDRTFKCQDVFVTKNGTKQEPVLGWITNTIIQEVATV